MPQGLVKLSSHLSGVSAVIVGDVMLDRYWWGSVKRISPEAPVPVVDLKKSTFALGGAANVAANIAGLGAMPYLVGSCLVRADFRDVDVRVMMTSDEYAAISGVMRATRINLGLSLWGQQVT